MSFNNYEFDNILQERSAALDISQVSFREGSHYPLTLLIDPGEQLRIKINFDQQRFARASVRRILEQLTSLLDDFAADPSRPLSAYSLLSSDEKQRFLVDFNQTVVPQLNKNIVELFEEQVAKSPDAIALRFQGESLTYSQLNERTNQLANYLSRRGVGGGQITALCLDRSPEVIMAILGTLKAGAGYMPIDTGLPARRIAWMLEETRAPVILASQKYASILPESGAEIIYLDQDWKRIAAETSWEFRP